MTFCVCVCGVIAYVNRFNDTGEVMRADIEFVRTRFRRFNRELFMDTLPEPPLRISDAGRAMGMFVSSGPRVAGRPLAGACRLEISNRHDLAPAELEDIIIHEMIHYYIWYNGLRDTSPHGRLFRGMMNAINTRHVRHITVRHALSAESRASDCKRKNHYILYTRWRDGREGFTRMARTRIFEMWRVFSSLSDVVEMRWYYTTDPFFNRFPGFTTPKYMALTDEIRRHLAGCVECECDGTRFAAKTRK